MSKLSLLVDSVKKAANWKDVTSGMEKIRAHVEVYYDSDLLNEEQKGKLQETVKEAVKDLSKVEFTWARQGQRIHQKSLDALLEAVGLSGGQSAASESIEALKASVNALMAICKSLQEAQERQEERLIAVMTCLGASEEEVPV